MLEKTSIEYRRKKIDNKCKYIMSEIFLEDFLGKINACICERLFFLCVYAYTH